MIHFPIPPRKTVLSLRAYINQCGRLHKMILGTPQKLESQFRLTYNMILNLLRVQDFKVSLYRRAQADDSTGRRYDETEFFGIQYTAGITGTEAAARTRACSTTVISANT